MLYGLLLTLFVVLCFLLIAVILLQKSKSSMGLGSLGGSAQMLFGGSGGQDLFQKITWVMVTLFMFGSLVLAIMKSAGTGSFTASYKTRNQPLSRPAAPAAQPIAPSIPTSTPTQAS